MHLHSNSYGREANDTCVNDLENLGGIKRGKDLNAYKYGRGWESIKSYTRILQTNKPK